MYVGQLRNFAIKDGVEKVVCIAQLEVGSYCSLRPSKAEINLWDIYRWEMITLFPLSISCVFSVTQRILPLHGTITEPNGFSLNLVHGSTEPTRKELLWPAGRDFDMFGLLNFNWVSPMDFVFQEGADLLYLIFHFIFIAVMFCRGMIYSLIPH